MRSVYLIGCDHKIQHQHPNSVSDGKNIIIEEFKEFIISEIGRLNINIIGEEFSRELCEDNLVENSVIEQIANSVKINHFFCDPYKDERRKHGINNDDEREEYWINVLKNSSSLNSRILFICGHIHLKSVREKLIYGGFNAMIITEKCWGSEIP